MNRTFDEADVREIMESFGRKTGLSTMSVPIIISTRMKRTFGAYVFKKDRSGRLVPLAFKFSLKLLQGDFPERVVIDTIGHEYVHYYVNTMDNVNHNHDDIFRLFCRKLGVPEDTHFTGHTEPERKKGYVVTCQRCGRVTARRRRKDAALKIVRGYRSGCCNERMRMKEEIF